MYITKITNYLKNIFEQEGFLIEPKIVISNRPELCDLQCDDSFKLAKETKKSPIEIGEQITNAILNNESFSHYFSEVSFIKPGFINMTLSASFINNNLDLINNSSTLGVKQLETPETAILDYGGPNMAKPLHVGHLRPALIGESIKRILKFKGYNALGDVHLGDAGLQVGQVIYGIKQDFPNTKAEDIELTLDYLNVTYPRVSTLSKEDPEVLKACQNITRELQENNEEYHILWKKIFAVSYQDIKSIYDYLGVNFEIWGGEIETYPVIPEMLDYLEKEHVITTSEGMMVINVKQDDDKKEMPPFILKRSDGAYIYSTTDLATIYMRMKKYNPKYIMYVVDIRQSLHFEQLFRAANLANITPHTILEHNANGTINGPDNKPYKTRSGNTVKLSDLFEETKNTFLSLREDNINMDQADIDIIVNAILKFGELQNARDRNYIFDLEKFSSVIGKTGPYLLYTYLRLNKLIDPTLIKNNLGTTIYTNEEKELKLKLLQVTNVINKAADDRMPSYIAEYLYDLAVIANTFYQNNNISKLDDKTKKADLTTLISITTKVIKQLLELLIIDIPSKM